MNILIFPYGIIADEYLSSPIPSKYDWVRDVIVCGVALDRVRGMEKQERAWNIVRYRMDGHRVGWVSCDYGQLGFVYIRLNDQTDDGYYDPSPSDINNSSLISGTDSIFTAPRIRFAASVRSIACVLEKFANAPSTSPVVPTDPETNPRMRLV